MTPTIWFFCCLILWVIAFPVYVAGARPKLHAAKVAPSIIPVQASAPASSLTMELEKAHQLRISGVLTAAEYQAAKRPLIES